MYTQVIISPPLHLLWSAATDIESHDFGFQYSLQLTYCQWILVLLFHHLTSHYIFELLPLSQRYTNEYCSWYVVFDSTIVEFSSYSGVESPTWLNAVIFIIFSIIFVASSIILLNSVSKSMSTDTYKPAPPLGQIFSCHN
jgi:hypothetical protein